MSNERSRGSTSAGDACARRPSIAHVASRISLDSSSMAISTWKARGQGGVRRNSVGNLGEFSQMASAVQRTAAQRWRCSDGGGAMAA